VFAESFKPTLTQHLFTTSATLASITVVYFYFSLSNRRNGMPPPSLLSCPQLCVLLKLATSSSQRPRSPTLAPSFQILTFSEHLQATTIRSIKSLVPLLDRVLVQRVKAEAKTASGIFLPESSVKELNEGKVLAVGPGALDKDGKRLPMGVQNGDRVLIPQVCLPRDKDGRGSISSGW